MPTETRKIVTIVTEAILEHDLIEDIERLGANGYTITEARGKGHKGVRNADWSTSGNIRIEIICNEITATKIAVYCKEHYYNNYAMILFMHDIDVVRSQKF